LFFVINVKQFPFSSEELGNIPAALALRILWILHSPHRTLYEYSRWQRDVWNKKPEGLTATSVLETTVKSGLAFLVMDEAQLLTQGNIPYIQILSTIYETMLNVRHSGIHLIPILSGTSAARISDPIHASAFQYTYIVLPLLNKPELVQTIISSITGSPMKNQVIVDFLMIMTVGHPRVLEAFLSVASQATAQSISDASDPNPEETFHYDGKFYPNTFQQFLEETDKGKLWGISANAWQDVNRYLPSMRHWIERLNFLIYTLVLSDD